MTAPEKRPSGDSYDHRKRNWLAIALATIVMMFSYFPYAASFVTDEAGTVQINVGLVGIALALAPFVFVVLAFVSQHPRAPWKVLHSMMLLIPVALAVGLLSPVLGATAGFGVGGALCLRPLDRSEAMKWRWWAVGVTVLYTLFLLVVVTPAGVFTGGLLPLMMVGFADEYTEWRATRSAA